MVCPECNTENKQSAQFCSSCGKKLQKEVKEKKEIKEVKEEKKEVKFTKNKIVELLLTSINELKGYLLKPLDSMKNEKTEDAKSVCITGAIIVFAMMLINLVITMFNSARVLRYSWMKGSYYEWSFDGVKSLNYFSLIFKNFIVYALIIAFVALVFYVASLIIKKQISYFKVLSMLYVALVPLVLGNMILVPLVNLLSIHFAVVMFVLTSIYAISIFTILLNSELKLEGTLKLYFNTAAYSVLIIISYIIIYNMAASFLSSLGI